MNDEIKKEFNLFSVKVADLRNENLAMAAENKRIAEGMEQRRLAITDAQAQVEALTKLEEEKGEIVRDLDSKANTSRDQLRALNSELQATQDELSSTRDVLDHVKEELALTNDKIILKSKELDGRQAMIETNEATQKNYGIELDTKEALLRKREEYLVIQEQLHA